ncbi:MAG TPA: hypothetical protein VHK91_00605 [Flavisolibacter sp.]|jgi:hypothetical protein|nr:hypothetical protein [Flavisolibacter sp.]
MKSKHLLTTLSFTLLLLSCSPVIYYLGDNYDPTSNVEVFYDAAQVKKEYRVMGHMTKEISLRSESDKKAMVKEAQKRGADGIIFSDLSMSADKKSEQVSVKAELIKYL